MFSGGRGRRAHRVGYSQVTFLYKRVFDRGTPNFIALYFLLVLCKWLYERLSSRPLYLQNVENIQSAHLRRSSELLKSIEDRPRAVCAGLHDTYMIGQHLQLKVLSVYR